MRLVQFLVLAAVLAAIPFFMPAVDTFIGYVATGGGLAYAVHLTLQLMTGALLLYVLFLRKPTSLLLLFAAVVLVPLPSAAVELLAGYGQSSSFLAGVLHSTAAKTHGGLALWAALSFYGSCRRPTTASVAT